jgi:hypothetical protein
MGQLVLAFLIVAAILFLIDAYLTLANPPNWPRRLTPLGLFFLTASFIAAAWGK